MVPIKTTSRSGKNKPSYSYDDGKFKRYATDCSERKNICCTRVEKVKKKNLDTFGILIIILTLRTQLYHLYHKCNAKKSVAELLLFSNPPSKR